MVPGFFVWVGLPIIVVIHMFALNSHQRIVTEPYIGLLVSFGLGMLVYWGVTTGHTRTIRVSIPVSREKSPRTFSCLMYLYAFFVLLVFAISVAGLFGIRWDYFFLTFCMDKRLIIGAILVILLVVSVLPIWPKSLSQGGEIKINFWQKMFMKID